MQLVSEYNYYKTKETLTEDGYFYSTVEHLEKETCLSKHDQSKAIQILTNLKIIQIVLRGIPAKRHFKIDFDAFGTLFDKIATARKPRKIQLSENSPTSRKKFEQQDSENLDTNNKIYNNNDNDEIDRLKDCIINTPMTKSAKRELEQEFERLKIDLSDDYIKLLPQNSYRKFLLMQASVTSIFCTPHKQKLSYLDAKKIRALLDKYREYAEKAYIEEPVKYFKKILLEYADEQIPV